MTSVDDLLGEATLAEESLKVCLDGKLLARWRAVHREWSQAVDGKDSLGEISAKSRLAAELKELDEQIKAKSHTLTIRALGGPRWSALMAEHPEPDPKQGLGFNDKTFPQAAMAACIVDPVMTVEQAERLLDLVADGERTRIVIAISNVNMQGNDVPFDAAVYESSRRGG